MSVEKLGRLHQLVAADLLDAVARPKKGKARGLYIAQAIRLLKHNGIVGPGPGRASRELLEALHRAVAERLLNVMTDPAPVRTSTMDAARAFLKANEVTDSAADDEAVSTEDLTLPFV